MENKIRLKIGTVEVEYAGSEEFIRTELLGLFSKLAELGKQFQIPHTQQQDSEDPALQPDPPKSGKITLSIGTIATRLGVKSGPELVTAAAAHLAIVESRGQFTRVQLNDAMKLAAGYYKSSYTGNLTNILKSLVKSEVLNEVSTGRYSLRAPKRKEIESRLAD
ncbi:hypothetical protein ACFLS5_01375 [Candidatus Bipolaricaulota bacterium]